MNAGFVSLREQATYFALLELPKLGEMRVKRLISNFRSPTDSWLAIAAEKSDEEIQDFTSRVSAIELEIEHSNQRGIKCISLGDEKYPENLFTSRFAPHVLFGYGNLGISTARSVAVIGTSSATQSGVRNVSKLIADAVDNGYVIVSGLARGIDTAAHRAALSANGITVAVVGTGLNTVYPPENRELLIEITKPGAVFSKFLPSFNGARWSFPERNKVMAGMACATIVMESRPGSGSLLQAKAALSDQRRVFIHQSNLEKSENSEWLDRLVKQGAVLFDSFAEIEGDLGQSNKGASEFLF